MPVTRAGRSLAIALVVAAGLALAPPAGAVVGGVDVRVVGGAVTLKAEDVSLTTVLFALGRRAGVRVRVESALESRLRAERVTAVFSGVPVEEAWRRVLKGHNFTLGYGPAGVDDVQVFVDGSTGFREVTRPAKGGPGGRADRPPRDRAAELAADTARVASLREALLAADARARLQAVQELSSIDRPELTAAPIADALARERDGRVLEELLWVVEGTLGARLVADDSLRRLAASDRDGEARARALELLAERDGDSPGTRSLLQGLARGDPHPLVRETARTVLDGLQNPRAPAPEVGPVKVRPGSRAGTSAAR